MSSSVPFPMVVPGAIVPVLLLLVSTIGIAAIGGYGIAGTHSEVPAAAALAGAGIAAPHPAGSIPDVSTLTPSHRSAPSALTAQLDPVSPIREGVPTVPVGGEPRTATYDAKDGDVYVSNFQTNNVSIINGSTLVGTLPVGIEPGKAAFDSGNGYVYVPNSGSGNVSVISGSALIGSVSTGGSLPLYAVYDSANGYIYVSNSNSGSVAIISGLALLGSVTVGSSPEGLTYDSGNGYVYVPNAVSDNVSVVDGTTIIGSVNVSPFPGTATYDAANGYVYISPDGFQVSPFADSVSVVNGTTLLAALTISSPSSAIFDAACYNPATGFVYVSNPTVNSVSVINGTSILWTLHVGSGPGVPTYSSESGYIYVPNEGSDNVSLISYFSVVGSVPVGTAPGFAVYDPGNDNVYVLDGLGGGPGNVSVIPTAFSITFAQSGLPIGSSWSVELNGTALAPKTVAVTFLEREGTYGYLVRGPTGYLVLGIPPVGLLTGASGTSATETILFVKGATRTLTFHESGLARGATWCVIVSLTSCSTGATIALKGLTPWTYPYSVPPIPGYHETVALGKLAVGNNSTIGLAAASAAFRVTFTQLTYGVTFNETGLAIGTEWVVKITGRFGGQLRTITHSSRTSSIEFQAPNGSFLYSVGPVRGFTTPAPGSVTVAGGPAAVGVTYVPIPLLVRPSASLGGSAFPWAGPVPGPIARAR